MNLDELRFFFDQKVEEYNELGFIENDPISIPHQYEKRENIEISAFFAALFAWGQRKTIIAKSRLLMELMDDSPYAFVRDASEKDLQSIKPFVHRTLNSDDVVSLILGLRAIYVKKGGLEWAFLPKEHESNAGPAISRFRLNMLEHAHDQGRVGRHLSNPMAGSAAKRLIMFLRWMVRRDNSGVDFGIWKNISPALLSCPLDVHTSRISRHYGLITRKQNDWKAVEELDKSLRIMDAKDPAKYDFALFGLGIERAGKRGG